MASNVGSQRTDHGPVESFIEHEAPRFHAALGPRPAMDHDTPRFYVVVGSRSTIDHDGDDEGEGSSVRKPKKDSLPSSLEKLERTLDDFKTTTRETLDFNVSECRWRDVTEQLEEAIKLQHDRDEEKIMGIKLGKVRERMDKAQKIGTPALECIPGEVGLSVLKGGLAVIFTIARMRKENADKIVNTFQNVPDLLVEAEEARQAHIGHGSREDEHPERGSYKWSFLDALEELYVKLANGLKKLIKFFTERRLKNYFQSALKGAEIDAVNDSIRTCMNRVRGLDKRLRDQRVATFHSDVNAQFQQVHRKLSNGSDLNAGYTSEVSAIVKTMRKDIKERASEASIVNLTTEIQEMKGMLRDLANEGLFEFLDESLRQFKDNRPLDSPIDTASQFDSAQLAPATKKSYESLVHSIGRNAAKSFIVDIELVLRKQGSITRPALQEARTLWQSRNFLSWLNSRDSDVLFVLSASPPAGRTSALSIVCASLAVKLLGEDYRPFSAHFFCGEHTRTEDLLAGPEGMVCSLVVQMVVHLHAQGMLHLDDEWAWQLTGGMGQAQGQGQSREQQQTQPGASRLGVLFRMFGELLKQLPEYSTLFLILDGVSHYKKEEEEVLWVMQRLMDMAFNRDAVPAPVKFLLTGPTRSDSLIRGLGLRDYQVVTLNRAALAGGMARGPQHLRPDMGTGRRSF